MTVLYMDPNILFDLWFCSNAEVSEFAADEISFKYQAISFFSKCTNLFGEQRRCIIHA